MILTCPLWTWRPSHASIARTRAAARVNLDGREGKGEQHRARGSGDAAAGHHAGPPDGKVIAAVAPEKKDALVAALAAAGYDGGRIDVVTNEDLNELDSPIDRSGLPGLVHRFLFSLGGELDEIEKMRQELAGGHVLIGVPVESEEAARSTAAIMRDNGGHGISHFGRWTITDF